MSDRDTRTERAILGIDLGITGVTMALFDEDGRTRVVPNADGDDSTPAVLHLFEADGVAVGTEARKMMAIEPHLVVEDLPWRLGEADWRPQMHGQSWTAQELVGLLLRKLREDASELRGAEIRRAVLAVPAWYDSARRAAAVAAAQLGGLEVKSLVNQPLCAALGAEVPTRADDGTVVVFDLGGRDLEITLLQKEGEALTVRSSTVRYDLCVRAFELKLRALLVDKYRAVSPNRGTEDEHLAQQVVDAAHAAIAALGHRDVAATRIAHAGVQVKVEIDRDTFGAHTAGLVVSAVGLIDTALAEIGESLADVSCCVAVGRGCRLPNVRRALQERFGERLLLPSHPDQVVALGAARLAVLRHDRSHPGLSAKPLERPRTEDVPRERLDEPAPSTTRAAIGLADGGHVDTSLQLRDATTQDLGLIALDRERQERVIRLIPKGTPVPCEVKGRFTYAYEGMTGVRVEVTEGDGAARDEVTVIGVVELRGLPPRPVGTPIEIIYRYGEDRILQVQVLDVDTGIRRDGDIHYRGSLSEDEVRRATRRSDTIQLD
ncbi:MAG: Hsp70 family protein [Alphaproteobacteria bacterium]|nr:Hsp70 family protein [Alphaproteobacteria bacterium]